MDLRPILAVVGLFLTVFGLGMLAPAVVDYATHDFDWQVFAVAAAVTVFIGVGLVFAYRPKRNTRLTLRQTFVLTSLSWVTIATFGALPFAFSNLPMSFTDAFFESMSGLTTTGSTVLSGLDTTPVGILLWRAMLQWAGGIGIVVTAVAVLPYLRVGGMQLFRTESSDRSEKVVPKLSQMTGEILAVYVTLTGLCAGLLWLAGMTPFEATAHAMTTVSTGGYSTADASVGYFNSALVEAVIIVFMLAGGVTFTLYLQSLHDNPSVLWRNSQVRWFLGLVAIAAGVIAGWQFLINDVALATAIRSSLFNVVSIVTTTGFASADYSQWGTFPVVLLHFLTFVGSCTGSTSGGLKIFRFQVLSALTVALIRRTLHPHGMFQPTYEGRVISEAVGLSVMGFFFLFGTSFAVLALLLSLCGLDLVTSVSGAATAIANVGPGLGDVIGPAGNFASLPDPAKLLLAAGMLLGRLELLTVLILFSPDFWRA
ncbi:MAG: TrkH family potassium uptake protein [Rhodospirillales bacterium]|nr:TrkH family potassium uptake protein [Rhodospirillales bacterium]